MTPIEITADEIKIGREAERSAIVAWLRDESDKGDFGTGNSVEDILSYAAWRIERAEHMNTSQGEG